MTGAPRGWAPALLAALGLALSACAASMPAPAAERTLDALFAPPGAAEVAAVAAEWAERAPRAADVRVEWTGEGADGARTLVLSHLVDGHRHYGAVRVPGGEPGRRLPVLAVLHGGSRGTTGLELLRTGEVADGWVQVLPTFRSERLYLRPFRWYRSEGPPSPWDRDVDDAMALLDAVLQSVPEADSSRIALLGRSRGAGVALLMAVRDPRVRGVVTYSGPTDFFLPEVRRLGERALRSRVPRLPGAGYLADSVLFALRDGRTTVPRARLELVRRSPVYFAERLPPLLVHHGERDGDVHVAHALRLERVLADLGAAAAPWEVHRYPEGGHRRHSLRGHRERTEAFLRAISAGRDPFPPPVP